jgi:AsmA protein
MKRVLAIVGVVIAVLVLIVVVVSLLVNANTFRPQLEAKASQALGRKVQIGNLGFSLFSGSLTADNVSIADDSRFSQSPFLTASSLKVGVEVWPLLTSKQLNITGITIDQPVVHLISNASNQWNYATLASPANSAPNQPKAQHPGNLTIASFDLKNGQVTITPDGAKSPSVYNNVQMHASDFSLTSAFPIKLSMDLPGGGTMKLSGNAGPMNPTDETLTPIEADVHIDSFDIAKSGLVDPGSGVGGLVDLTGHLSAVNGKAHIKGAATMHKLKLAVNGEPSSGPVTMDFDLDYMLANSSGTLNSGLLRVGHAQANLNGTFASKGDVTSIDLTVNGQSMPVDDLFAVLPAFGVILPSGSKLQGGTMSTKMHAQGPTSALQATGNIGIYNTHLAGFDLGSELAAVSKITGGPAPSGNTQIQRLTSNIHYSPVGIQASNIDLVVTNIGQVTGSGTLSANNALNFHLVAQLSSGGALSTALGNVLNRNVSTTKLPFAVQGTASHPKIIPDVSGIVGGILSDRLGGAAGKKGTGNTNSNTVQQLGQGLRGLFGKKH